MADYSVIIDAIDAAILDGASKPGTVTSSDGRSVVYRGLKELTDARERFVRLQNAAARPRKGFTLRKFKAQ